jgi:hypothetical protein
MRDETGLKSSKLKMFSNCKQYVFRNVVVIYFKSARGSGEKECYDKTPNQCRTLNYAYDH